MINTTSPSYPILASIEENINYLRGTNEIKYGKDEYFTNNYNPLWEGIGGMNQNYQGDNMAQATSNPFESSQETFGNFNGIANQNTTGPLGIQQNSFSQNNIQTNFINNNQGNNFGNSQYSFGNNQVQQPNSDMTNPVFPHDDAPVNNNPFMHNNLINSYNRGQQTQSKNDINDQPIIKYDDLNNNQAQSQDQAPQDEMMDDYYMSQNNDGFQDSYSAPLDSQNYQQDQQDQHQYAKDDIDNPINMGNMNNIQNMNINQDLNQSMNQTITKNMNQGSKSEKGKYTKIMNNLTEEKRKEKHISNETQNVDEVIEMLENDDNGLQNHISPKKSKLPLFNQAALSSKRKSDAKKDSKRQKSKASKAVISKDFIMAPVINTSKICFNEGDSQLINYRQITSRGSTITFRDKCAYCNLGNSLFVHGGITSTTSQNSNELVKVTLNNGNFEATVMKTSFYKKSGHTLFAFGKDIYSIGGRDSKECENTSSSCCLRNFSITKTLEDKSEKWHWSSFKYLIISSNFVTTPPGL